MATEGSSSGQMSEPGFIPEEGFDDFYKRLKVLPSHQEDNGSLIRPEEPVSLEALTEADLHKKN